MSAQRRENRKTAPVGRRTPGELMQQRSSGEKHPTPMSVAELQKQGKPQRHGGTAHMSVKEMMKQ